MASVTGLEGIVAAETELSLVDGEKGYLVYRGYEAKALALEKLRGSCVSALEW